MSKDCQRLSRKTQRCYDDQANPNHMWGYCIVFINLLPLGYTSDYYIINRKIYRGYYTVTRRYEFYVLVARTISYEWAQRTSDILFLPWEHKIHIFELTCNVHLDFRRFSKIVPKARQTFLTMFREFRKFLKMSEDFQRLSRKTRSREEVSMIHRRI